MLLQDATLRIWARVGADEDEDEDEDAAGLAAALDHGDDQAWKCVAIGTGHAEAVSAVALSSDASVDGGFAVTGSSDLTVKLWPLTAAGDGTPVAPTALVATYTRKAHDKEINSVAVAPNNKVFATGSQDKTAKLWSVDAGALLGTFKGHRRGVWCVQFSPVDQVLATASGDTTVKLWSVKDFACIGTFEGHQSSVIRVVFLSRGVQLASAGSDGLVKVWNLKSSECVATVDAHENKVRFARS